jgi:polyphosphate glucokinase
MEVGMKSVLGIDVGGSGIKGGIVDVDNGKMISQRLRVDTPPNGDPKEIAELIHKMFKDFSWKGTVGVGFPAVILDGVALSAANVSPGWIGMNVNELLSNDTGCRVYTVNDADAAGVAEMDFGAGKTRKHGVVMMLTLGTGIGSAIFIDGTLVPNTELGHLMINGKDAEKWTSAAVKEKQELSWKKWSNRLQVYFDYLEKLFSPNLFIVGGGVSKDAEKFIPRLKTRAAVIPAEYQNQAGIIGSALFAANKEK